MKTSMEHWWDDTERGKPKYWEINLYQCHFVYHKSHIDWFGIEPNNKPASVVYESNRCLFDIYTLWEKYKVCLMLRAIGMCRNDCDVKENARIASE
jgi:hypothetical protein